jgi:hypothetical protein
MTTSNVFDTFGTNNLSGMNLTISQFEFQGLPNMTQSYEFHTGMIAYGSQILMPKVYEYNKYGDTLGVMLYNFLGIEFDVFQYKCLFSCIRNNQKRNYGNGHKMGQA